MSDTPSVGRIVHYVSHGSPVRPDGTQAYSSECRAAVITEVVRGDIGLCVLNPTGQFFSRGVEHGAPNGGFMGGTTKLCGGLDYAGGTWHWPERV